MSGERGYGLLAVALGVLVAALEGGLLALPAREWPAGPIVAVQLLGAVALSACGALAYAHGERNPVVLLFVISTAVLGLLGAVGAAVMALLHRLFLRRAIPFEAWYATLFPQAEQTRSHQLRDDIVLRRAGPGATSLVAPFADALRLGDVTQKHAVLVLVADNFQPAFAPILRQALNDAEPAIRVQAATTAAKIENRFLERWMVLQKARAERADDPELALDMARHHDDYAATGLLDTARADATRRQALQEYMRYTELTGDAAPVAHSIARLLLDTGQNEELVAWLERIGIDRLALSDLGAPYAEGLFRLRRYEDLRRACARMADNDDTAGGATAIEGALALWSRPDREEVAS